MVLRLLVIDGEITAHPPPSAVVETATLLLDTNPGSFQAPSPRNHRRKAHAFPAHWERELGVYVRCLSPDELLQPCGRLGSRKWFHPGRRSVIVEIVHSLPRRQAHPMAPKLDPFEPGTLEAISRTIGDAFTGQVIGRMLATTGLSDSIDLSTKWKRIFTALANEQNWSRSGTPVVTFIKEAASPSNSSGDAEAHERLVQALNVPLALAGYKLMLDGRMFHAPKASTVSEAQRRADRMRDELVRRRVHPDVLRFCRAELVAKDYFHAVFEVAKSVAEKLRSITGLTTDAVTLVQTAFDRGGAGPYLLVNDLKDPSDLDDHDGVAAIMRGVFKVFRNVPAHVPRVYSTVTEQDAMDLLMTVSYLHRRLDMATPTARAASGIT
jgi:uncharacterized protein (TIGR02391 family)